MVRVVEMDQFNALANQFHADYNAKWSDEKKWEKMLEMQDKQLTASFGKDEKKMAQVSSTNGVMPDSYAKIFTDAKQGDPIDDLWKFSFAKVGAAMKDYNNIKMKEMHSFLFLQFLVSLAVAGAVWHFDIPASYANSSKWASGLCNCYKHVSSPVRFCYSFASFSVHLLDFLTVFDSF